MKPKSFLCALMLFLSVSVSFAQQSLTCRGTVRDRSGQPMPGVAVLIKGTQVGSMTDINGYYVVDVPSVGTELEFLCMGYKTQVQKVPKSLNLDVFLDEDTLEMEEAVVVGMGYQRKASVIGAISAVKNDELQIPQRNLTNALAGKVAGAVVVQRSGEPGLDNAEFWIRGISTFSTSNSTPLVLVDGVERSMSDLAIEEIESISVLKDASATAVYGVRGANGVVLVTTRKGIAQKPEISVKIEGGVTAMQNLPKMISGADYMRLANEYMGSEMYSEEAIYHTENHTDPFLYPDVDWVKTMFKPYSNNYSASVSVRGGGERARYYVTFAYLKDNGNFYNNPDNDYSSNIHLTRYNFRSNVDMTLTKTTTLTLEIGANMTDTHQPGVANGVTNVQSTAAHLFSLSLQNDPVSMPVRVPLGYDEDGNIQWGFGTTIGANEVNPAARLYAGGYNQNYSTQVMSQITLKQDLSAITPGLSFSTSVAYDLLFSTFQARHRNVSLDAVTGVDDETGLYKLTQTTEGNEYLNYEKYYGWGDYNSNELKAQLLYDRVFADKHRVGAMAMYYQTHKVMTSAYTSLAALPYRTQGFAGRLTYSYDDRYFFEGNAGYNGTENFEKGNRFGLFPAAAFGYLISNEPFWGLKAINHLKLRGSIGLVGSDKIGGRRFMYISTWGSGLGGHYFGPSGSWGTGIGEDQIGVYGLTWEKGLKKDLGLELKLFRSAISLDIDVFQETRSDILIQRQTIPGIAGLNSAPSANMGVLDNRGLELTAEINHHIGPVNYRIYGNFSYADNTIIDMDEGSEIDPWRAQTGHCVGQQFGYIAEGLFASEDEIANSPKQTFSSIVRPGDVKYKDIAGAWDEDGNPIPDGVINIHDMTAIGDSRIPKINYGFGLQLSYKGFDAGCFFRGQSRVTYQLSGYYFPFYYGIGKGNAYAAAMDRWTPENPDPNARYPRLSAESASNNRQASTRTIYDGSLIRLSDIEVGYTLRSDKLKDLGCSSIRFYLVGNNIWMHSNWDMWDPETGSANGSAYPLSRKINLGVKMNF